jgi:hypothetical protein
MSTKIQIPDWVTRGKTVRQLIAELQSFEDQELEVRLSLDSGRTHGCISLVSKLGERYCLLENAEADYRSTD